MSICKGNRVMHIVTGKHGRVAYRSLGEVAVRWDDGIRDWNHVGELIAEPAHPEMSRRLIRDFERGLGR